MSEPHPLRKTPLFAAHRTAGAKIVPFSGWEMPVHYTAGILGEHRHCREHAALFDVSHMGQVMLHGADADGALETLVPGDIRGLAMGRMRYTQFTDDAGGILDDLMVTRVPDGLFLVVNAGRRDHDIAHLRHGLPKSIEVEELADRALIALQGPKAETVLARLTPTVAELGFMQCADLDLDGVPARITRSGYTGEDGFEISVPADAAEATWQRLASEPEVLPAGLGARDSLRLEAGLCLWGHDIDTTTTPVEAGLVWSIGKRRREDGGFPGAGVVLRQLREGPARKRVGLRPADKAPAREHSPIQDADGREIGIVTSGGFGPTVGGPIAMGYVESGQAETGRPVQLVVRGRARQAQIAAMPFVPNRYKR